VTQCGAVRGGATTRPKVFEEQPELGALETRCDMVCAFSLCLLALLWRCCVLDLVVSALLAFYFLFFLFLPLLLQGSTCRRPSDQKVEDPKSCPRLTPTHPSVQNLSGIPDDWARAPCNTRPGKGRMQQATRALSCSSHKRAPEQFMQQDRSPHKTRAGTWGLSAEFRAAAARARTEGKASWTLQSCESE
jgi:hypothetical protein